MQLTYTIDLLLPQEAVLVGVPAEFNFLMLGKKKLVAYNVNLKWTFLQFQQFLLQYLSAWTTCKIPCILEYPHSQTCAIFGCTKNEEGLVSFLTCVMSRVERW